MIINGSNLIGADILLSKDKKKVGQISDLVMNPKKQEVDAFLLSNGHSGQALLFKDAKQVKQDEVIIDSEKVFKSVEHIVQENPENDVIASKPVTTKKGEAVGVVDDVFFDTASGQVKELSVQDPDAQSPEAETLIKSKEIVSIGEDAVIVKSLSSKTQKKSSSSHKSSKKSGGMMKQAESAAKQVYKTAKSSLKKMT